MGTGEGPKVSTLAEAHAAARGNFEMLFALMQYRVSQLWRIRFAVWGALVAAVFFRHQIEPADANSLWLRVTAGGAALFLAGIHLLFERVQERKLQGTPGKANEPQRDGERHAAGRWFALAERIAAEQARAAGVEPERSDASRFDWGTRATNSNSGWVTGVLTAMVIAAMVPCRAVEPKSEAQSDAAAGAAADPAPEPRPEPGP